LTDVQITVQFMSGIYLGLGTNLGDREKNLIQAIEYFLASPLMNVCRWSSVYQTEPLGNVQQADFLNMNLEIETRLSPIELLAQARSIENQLGRKRSIRWGPRIIDVDILSYYDRCVKNSALIIPHQHLHLRRFVLVPLKEIADQYFHPKLNKTIDQLLTECPDKRQVIVYKKAAKLKIRSKCNVG